VSQNKEGWEMKEGRLDEIQSECQKALDHAVKIINGDSNYDGADGARKVIVLCHRIQELIFAIRTSEAHK
jgi:hypothetical protein